MSKLVIAVVIGLLGLIVGLNLDDNSSRSTVSEISPTNMTMTMSDGEKRSDLEKITAEILQLSTLVKQEQALRLSLADELKTLKNSFASLEKNQQNIDVSTVPHTSEIIVNSANKTEAANETIASETTLTEFEQPKSTSAILASIGIDPGTAENIERRSEKSEMEQLYLRNKAVREGWFGTEKFFEESKTLEQNNNVIQQEIGDTKYDEYLYTAGKFNRIQVADVIATSPAENVGIQNGDIIYSYDNKRIFSWSDLTTLSAGGEPGEQVEVSIMRNKTLTKLFIPRGPLGIRLESLRIDPKNS